MNDLKRLLADELATNETTRVITLADGSAYTHGVGPVSYTTKAQYSQDPINSQETGQS